MQGWTVKSNTTEGVEYHVTFDGVGWECTCPFVPNKTRRHCSHILAKQAEVVAGKLVLDERPVLDEEWNVLTQPGGVKPGLDQAKENMSRVLAEHGDPGPDDAPGAGEDGDVAVPVPGDTGPAEEPAGERLSPEAAPEADPHDPPDVEPEEQRPSAEEVAAVEAAFEEAGKQKPLFEVTNIDTAIAAVYAEVAYVQKQRAEQLNYSFAGEAAIIQALRPALVRHGITVHVSKVKTPKRERYETKSGGWTNNSLVKGQVTFTHAPTGTTRKVWAWGEGSDSGDKSIAKALTGLYKYALRQTFSLETGDDPDLHASSQYERAGRDQARVERENRRARQDVLRRGGGGGETDNALPRWWQWFISQRNNLGLTGADLAHVLAGAPNPPRVQEWLDSQEPKPTTQETISAALQKLLSQAADSKAGRQA